MPDTELLAESAYDKALAALGLKKWRTSRGGIYYGDRPQGGEQEGASVGRVSSHQTGGPGSDAGTPGTGTPNTPSTGQSTYQGGSVSDGGNTPDVGGSGPNQGAGEVPDFSEMSSSEIDSYMDTFNDQMEMMQKSTAPVPGIPTAMKGFQVAVNQAAKSAQQNISDQTKSIAEDIRSEHGVTFGGTPADQQGDPGNPEGQAGEGGTGSGEGAGVSVGGDEYGGDQGGYAAGGQVTAKPTDPPVPPGQNPDTADNVKAKLSEGEFIIPADVVRFLGADKLNKMIMKAKTDMSEMDKEQAGRKAEVQKEKTEAKAPATEQVQQEGQAPAGPLAALGM